MTLTLTSSPTHTLTTSTLILRIQRQILTLHPQANVAVEQGGAVATQGWNGSQLAFTGTNLTGNSAGQGGALICDSGTALSLQARVPPDGMPASRRRSVSAFAITFDRVQQVIVRTAPGLLGVLLLSMPSYTPAAQPRLAAGSQPCTATSHKAIRHVRY